MRGTFLFVLDRGFVVVGNAEVSTELAFTWKLSPGRTVRRWGTTHGLTELKNGPLRETVLDPPAVEYVPFRAVLRIIEVSEEKWKKHLSA